MNDTLIITLFYFLMFVVILQVFKITCAHRSYRKYKLITKAEKTRSHFAELRNQLLDLVINEKLDINSKAFTSLHFLYTTIMRRPDQYSEISNAILQAILEKDKQIKKSSSVFEISNEVKGLLTQTVVGLDIILYNYSFFYRFIKFMSVLIHKVEIKPLEEKWKTNKKKWEKSQKDTTIKSITSGRDKILELSAA